MLRFYGFSKSTRWNLIWFSSDHNLASCVGTHIAPEAATAAFHLPKPSAFVAPVTDQVSPDHVSLLVRVGAPFSTELMRLVRVRPRLRAVPLVAAANLAADLHLLASLAAVSPAVADVLASLGTTLGRTMVSEFVFGCAPPTSWAIGRRHCS